jgi:hypothetical protein
MAKPTPGENIRAQLEHKRRTLPMFLRPQLGDVLGSLDDWIASVELRLAAQDAQIRGLNKMPSPAALDALVGA